MSRSCLGEREAVLTLGHVPVTKESSMDMGQAIGGLPPTREGPQLRTTRAPAGSGFVRSFLTWTFLTSRVSRQVPQATEARLLLLPLSLSSPLLTEQPAAAWGGSSASRAVG